MTERLQIVIAEALRANADLRPEVVERKLRWLSGELRTHATRLQQMREALENYGSHSMDCDVVWPKPGGPCTCGYDAALAASPEED
jgi:hypothetical protein